MVNYDAERIKREYPRRPLDDNNPGPSSGTPPPAQQNRASNESKKFSVPRQTAATVTPRQRNDSKTPQQQQQQPLQKNRPSQSQYRGRSSAAASEEDPGSDPAKKRLTITERMEKAHREHLSNKFMKIEHAPKDNVELNRQAYWGYSDYHDSDAHWDAIREERGGKQKTRAQSMMMNASSKEKTRGKGDTNHPPQTRASQMRMMYVQKKLSKGNDRRRSSSVVDPKSMLKKRDSKPMTNNTNGNGGIWNKNDGKNQKKSSTRDSDPDPDGAKRLRPTKAQTRLAKGSVTSSEGEGGKRPPPKRDRLRSKKDSKL